MRHRRGGRGHGLDCPLSARALGALVFLCSCGVAFAQGQEQVPQQPLAPQPQAQQMPQEQVGRTTVEVELEGPAAQVRGQCPQVQFSLGGFTVSTDARTEFDDGSCEELVDGKHVEVEGVSGPDSSVTASEVDLD